MKLITVALAGLGFGALAGLLLAVLEIAFKDMRDAKLIREGHPLPRDRVPKYRPYTLVTAILGTVHAMAIFVATGWPALWCGAAVLVLPAGLFALMLLRVPFMFLGQSGKQ